MKIRINKLNYYISTLAIALIAIFSFTISIQAADGDADPAFNPNANNTIYSTAIQADGKIVVGGAFTAIGGTTRNNITRLLNTVQQAVTQTCTPAPVGLVSWFAADGNALDSRSRNNGTLQGGATFAAGKVGQAFQFPANGSSEVDVPDSPSLNFTNALTVEAWVNPSTPNTSVSFTPIVDKGFNNGSPNTYLLNFDPATRKVAFVIGSGGAGNATVATSVNPIPLNTYTYVVGTYDGTTVRLYINGVLDASQAGTISSLAPSGTGLAIGRSAGFFNTFYGAIDEVSLYNRTLSASEIQAIFNSGTAGKCKPTATVSPSGQVAWLAGDGNPNDISGNGNNGTLQNGAGFAVGKVGQGFNFNGLGNGNGSYVSTNLNVQPSALPTVTFETWVYPTRVNTAENQAILSADPGGYGRQVDIQQGSSMFEIQTGTINAYLPTNADVNQWQHIAVVYTPTDIKFYKNGVLFDSGITPTTGQAANNQFFIGSNRCPPCVSAGQTQPFQGGIDEVSVYNRELSPDEITSIVNAGVAGKLKDNATPTGSNVAVNAKSDATITFPTVSAAGTTQQIPLDPNVLPALPTGATATGLFYDIATSAAFTGNVTECFNLPLTGNAFTMTNFNNLKVLHLEAGVWQDRTTSVNFATRTLCGQTTTLSPFAIVLNYLPTAASVTLGGKVKTAKGGGIANVRVTLTDYAGQKRTVTTNSFGYYRFTEVDAGRVYVVGVSAKSYAFDNPTQVVSVVDNISELDFTALATGRKLTGER